jgi:hypothetical protein
MALTEQLKFKKLDVDVENWAISIAFIPVINKDNVEYLRGKLHRRAFVPGQIEDVKAFTGLDNTNKHIKYINSLWTQQVIDEYNAKIQGE